MLKIAEYNCTKTVIVKPFSPKKFPTFLMFSENYSQWLRSSLKNVYDVCIV